MNSVSQSATEVYMSCVRTPPHTHTERVINEIMIVPTDI